MHQMYRSCITSTLDVSDTLRYIAFLDPPSSVIHLDYNMDCLSMQHGSAMKFWRSDFGCGRRHPKRHPPPQKGRGLCLGCSRSRSRQASFSSCCRDTRHRLLWQHCLNFNPSLFVFSLFYCCYYCTRTESMTVYLPIAPTLFTTLRCRRPCMTSQ
jgi:hypothetical protein